MQKTLNSFKKSLKMFLSAVKNSIILSFVTGLIISFIFLFYAKDIVNLITSIEFLRYLSYKYLLWVIIIPPIASICYQLDGIFIGASQTAEMRNAMILSVLLFIISSLFLVTNFGNHGVWLSLLFFMIIRSVTLNYYFNKILNKF